MLKVIDEELIAAAKEAQYEVILGWVRNMYVDGTSRIAPYTDFLHRLSGFSASAVKVNLGNASIRSRLTLLAKNGVLERQQGRRKGAAVRFLFNREVCDELASKAEAYWESLGLCRHERRYLNGGNKK